MQESVGRYRIVRPLGRGAMGLVFLAEDPSLNRQVAIKMLDISADNATDREFLRGRLLRDARAAAILSHPNIVAVYDIVEEGQAVYVVMEYIEGESLASYLDHTPMPDNANLMRVLRQMAAGLDYTHSKGIIHRDIKPGNVMLSPNGNVKILDFGIARMSDVRTSTPTGLVMGTVDYMAPEQIKAEAMDGRADQFSLAAVAYRMLAGSTLFGRHTLATLAYKLVNEAPQPVCQRNALIPATVDPVLAKALSKSPSDRYPTCTAFVEALGKGLSGATDVPTATLVSSATRPLVAMSETTVKTPAAVAAVAAPVKRAGMAGWVVGGLLVATAGGGVAVWKPWSQPPAPATVPTTMTAAMNPPEKTAVETSVKPADEPAKPPAAEKTPGKAITPVAKTPDRPAVKVPDRPAVVDIPVSKPPDKPAVVEPPAEKMPETPVITVETTSPTPSLDTANAKDTGQDTPFKRGLEALRTKDYPEAVRHFTEVIGRRPKYGAAYYDRALAYQFQGDNTHAVQDYSDALRVGHRDVRTYTSKAICEVRLHQDDAALADFNSAIDIDSGAPVPLNGRGTILYRRKQYKLAIRDFSAAIKTNPEFGQAYENRANAKRMIGDSFGAADDFVVAKRLKQAKK